MPQFDNWSAAGKNTVLVKIKIVNQKIVVEPVEPIKSNSKPNGIPTIKKPISKNSVDFIPLQRTPT